MSVTFFVSGVFLRQGIEVNRGILTYFLYLWAKQKPLNIQYNSKKKWQCISHGSSFLSDRVGLMYDDMLHDVYEDANRDMKVASKNYSPVLALSLCHEFNITWHVSILGR